MYSSSVMVPSVMVVLFGRDCSLPLWTLLPQLLLLHIFFLRRNFLCHATRIFIFLGIILDKFFLSFARDNKPPTLTYGSSRATLIQSFCSDDLTLKILKYFHYMLCFPSHLFFYLLQILHNFRTNVF